MSFTDFKEISVNNPGTSIRYGGDDLKMLMQILNGKIVGSRRPKILNEWIWLDHFDMAPPATVPGSPTDTNASRIYIDPTNFKVKVKKTAGTILDIENVDIPEDALLGITSKNKIPASVAYEDEANIFTAAQNIAKTAEAGVAESLALLQISDDALSKFEVINATATDGFFAPQIKSWFRQASAVHPGLQISSHIPTANDSGTTPAFVFDARKDDNAAIATRPLFRFQNVAATLLSIMATSIENTLTTNNAKTAVASNAETLETWTITDASTTGIVRLRNASATDTIFAPWWEFIQSASASQTSFLGYGYGPNTDSGTVPIWVFDARKLDNSALATRPLFQFRNAGTAILTINATTFDFTNKTINNAILGTTALVGTYLDFDDTTTPANPSAGFRRIFADSANGSRLSIKKSDGTVLNLESAVITTFDSLTDVVITTPAVNQVPTWDGTNWVNATPPGAAGGEANTASNIGTAGTGIHKQKTGVDLEFYKLNALSNKVSIALDGANNKVDIDVTEANLTLNSIGGSISTRSKLPTEVVYDDEANTYGDFDQIVRSSRLKITNPANTFNYTIVASAITAARNITIPLITTDDIFVTAAFEMDITARKRFTDASFSLYNPGASFQYIFRTSAIAADRNVNIPLLTVDDTLVTESFAQSISNKTIDATFNTLLNIPDSAISGSGITTKSKLPATLAYEDEVNTFTSAQTFNSYADYAKIAAPADPAAETARQYFKEIDANNNTIAIKQEINGAIREVRAF